jgi:hypothetical protein
MSNLLPFHRARPSTELALAAISAIDQYGALLADASNPRTHRARTQDIADLGRYLGLADPSAVWKETGTPVINTSCGPVSDPMRKEKKRSEFVLAPPSSKVTP